MTYTKHQGALHNTEVSFSYVNIIKIVVKLMRRIVLVVLSVLLFINNKYYLQMLSNLVEKQDKKIKANFDRCQIHSVFTI